MRNLPFLILALSISVSGCMQNDPLRSAIGSYRNYTDFNGKIADGVLHDPCGRFTMKVPTLAEPGAVIRGRLEKEGGSVEFSDDFGKLIRIDLMTAVDPQSAALMRDADWKKLFIGNRAMLGELYKSVCPTTEIMHQEYIEAGRKIDFYVFNMPGGSTLTESGKRMDAWRASITVIEGNSLFTLTTQLIPGLWKNDASKQDIFMTMQKSLLELLPTVTFTPSSQPSKSNPR